nr:AT-rich interactive domain-containing protein 3A-like [Pelodiscus sinensis]|eukprot:XP_025043879.1 AT-rich interactive domain-containing protein 3A-like [Pelodiscus sinensis]
MAKQVLDLYTLYRLVTRNSWSFLSQHHPCPCSPLCSCLARTPLVLSGARAFSFTCTLSLSLSLPLVLSGARAFSFTGTLSLSLSLSGTPVNRIPIMAKQVLDLYTLYRLVTEKGGLVEVINKKIWREITKGLNLPTSITSAAFTLRTQYMKYLYPYECEKQALSSPGELQAAIDSNRREGRRQSFGAALFSYSPVGTPALLGSPKIPVPALTISTHSCSQMSQVHAIKKEDGVLSAAVPSRIAIPVSLAGHHLAASPGAPALQQNLLAMSAQFPVNIKISNRDDRQETALNLSTSGISSINMSIEINGVVYTEHKSQWPEQAASSKQAGGVTTQCSRPAELPARGWCYDSKSGLLRSCSLVAARTDSASQ